jgi:uncharacterized membrane protein
MSAEDLIFEAVITPHRSLSPRALGILIGAIAGGVSVTAGMFVWLGAWPVVAFSGIEVGLAGLLLRLNHRERRESEVLFLTPETLSIRRTDRHGTSRETTLPPAWLQVVLTERQGRVPRLALRAGRVEEEIAAKLGEVEKRDLANALEEALHRLRNPRFDNPQLAE